MSLGRTAVAVIASVSFLIVAMGSEASLRAAGATAPVVALPSSIGAAGDSVTNAYDVNATAQLQPAPPYSWSTGTAPAVDSQYRRVLAANKAIKGHLYNVAAFGAVMANLDAQMKTLAAHKVQYATVLMGDNDVCANTLAKMTPVLVFQSQFKHALTDFFAQDAHAHVYVSSIANVFRVWQLFHTNSQAEYVWNVLAPAVIGHGACPTILGQKQTAAQRATAVAREIAYNSVLAKICKTFANCRFDNDAEFNDTFTAADISLVDYVNPSVQGQARVAALSWKASFWPAK